MPAEDKTKKKLSEEKKNSDNKTSNSWPQKSLHMKSIAYDHVSIVLKSRLIFKYRMVLQCTTAVQTNTI